MWKLVLDRYEVKFGILLKYDRSCLVCESKWHAWNSVQTHCCARWYSILLGGIFWTNGAVSAWQKHQHRKASVVYYLLKLEVNKFIELFSVLNFGIQLKSVEINMSLFGYELSVCTPTIEFPSLVGVFSFLMYYLKIYSMQW